MLTDSFDILSCFGKQHIKIFSTKRKICNFATLNKDEAILPRETLNGGAYSKERRMTL